MGGENLNKAERLSKFWKTESESGVFYYFTSLPCLPKLSQQKWNLNHTWFQEIVHCLGVIKCIANG